MRSQHTFPWQLLLITLVAIAACAGGERDDGPRERLDPPPISHELQAELENWLSQYGHAPDDYVLGLFADHDVVLLGEQHRIRHDVLFVQGLLPQLSAAGVHVFATEFGRRADQDLIDSLVTDSVWREDLGREILFRQFMPWGYREYLDLLQTAWRINRDRPSGAPLLRVLGINNALDYGQFRSEEDWDDPEIWKLVLGDQTEEDWAKGVLEAVENGDKVLVHCGIHHAFSGYRQPRVENGRFKEFGRVRLGNFLREELGMRAVTVYLHAPWNGPDGYGDNFVHPADGRIDAFMLTRAGGSFPVGFDVAGSPLAELPIQDAVYKHGYEPFTLAEFCDGWIYTKPVGEYQPVAYIEDWIHEGNLVRARATAMNPRWRSHSVEEFNEGCRSYIQDFERWYGRLR